MRPAAPVLTVLAGILFLEAAQAMSPHVLAVAEPLPAPEDGLLLGNGDLSCSVYHTRDRVVFRFGKGDVWDRRVDYSDDPKPPTIQEVAHGIAVEGWKCNPYGDGVPVALHGTNNPQRMKELCEGTPPSYRKRPYPCPKPVGELMVQLPPDLPGLSVRQELTLEEGILRVTCTSPVGVEVRPEAFIPPEPNVAVLRWDIAGWDRTTAFGRDLPPLWMALYRWADPPIRDFGLRFRAEFGHSGFVSTMDADKCTPLPPPAVRRVGNRLAVEQTFHAEPTFPQGFRYAMAPFASAGDAAVQEQSAPGQARLTVRPPPEARSGWVVVAVPSESDPGGADAELARIAALMAPQPEARIALWEAAARKAAADFWARSGVEIADTLLENLWYETYHAKRCVFRAGKTPPGLFLPSTVQDYSHWHGDYHTNYNFQQPFYGDYTANHLEVGDAYFTGMAYLAQMGRLIAEKYYQSRGLFVQLTGYPIRASDDVLGAVPMGRMAYMTGWCANQYWWRYLYTLDEAWLRGEGYPFLRDCAILYLDLMRKGEDGLYHVFPSNQGEDGFTGDPKDYTDRAQVMRHLRYCLRCAILASEVLGVDEELREQWRDRLEHCAGDDGRPPVRREGLPKHFAEANPPEFGDGSVPRLPDLGEGPAWPPPEDGLSTWYCGQYPIAAIANLRSGGLNGHRAYAGLRRLVQRWRHPNGLVWAMAVANYGRAGAWTETLGITGVLGEMMLQSYGGVIRVFPAWPRDVRASYRTFRAEGAFLVSASWEAGTVTSLQITSEKGGPCRILAPWPEGVKVRTAAGQDTAAAEWAPGILGFDTKAGETYVLSRP